MTYAKLTETIPELSPALMAALRQNNVAEPVHADLLAAGAAVQLETGDKVWVSCIAHDRPETPQIDFITVAIACRPDVTPWRKPNGQIVASAFWHVLWPDVLANIGIDTVRRALMMIAMGEPQPKVPIPNPAPDGPTEQDAIPVAGLDSRSIRTAITAAAEVMAPPADVL